MLSQLTPRTWVVLVVLTLLAACAEPRVIVTEAHVRGLIPGRDTTAAYFTITNEKEETVTLTGAESTHARAIEMHETTSRDGRMAMRRLDATEIAAGATVAFEPGGKHLMLFGVSAVEEPYRITLVFASGERMEVPFSKLAFSDSSSDSSSK